MDDYLGLLAGTIAPVLRSHRYTMRGLEPSPLEGPFTVGRHVDDAMAILDGLGLGCPLILGHSWGGFVAAALAVIHPHRVGGLILIDSVGLTGDGGIPAFGDHFERSYPPEVKRRVAELNAISAKRALNVEEAHELALLDWPYYHANPASPPPFLDRRASPEAAREGPADTKKLLAEGFCGPLTELCIPTLVVGGARGPFPPRVFEQTAALIPGSSLVLLPDAGHYPWYEQPEALLGAIRTFVSERRGRAAAAPSAPAR